MRLDQNVFFLFGVFNVQYRVFFLFVRRITLLNTNPLRALVAQMPFLPLCDAQQQQATYHGVIAAIQLQNR